MKASSLALLCHLVLVLAFEANFQVTIAQTQNASNPVVDTSGQALRQGASYYISPAEGGDGGGLALEIGRNNTCPYEIVQTLEEGSKGLPLSFSPVTNDGLIRVDTDLNIRFTGQVNSPVICPQSNVWRINATGSEPVFVTTGGVAGNPGRQTLPNWFKIQKYEDGYQLQYCPSVSLCGNPCGILLLCENVGVFSDNGRRRLALNQPPFKVVFKRA